MGCSLIGWYCLRLVDGPGRSSCRGVQAGVGLGDGRSRSAAACWSINAALGEEWPMRLISSRVVAPTVAARVADRCRRSWNRTAGAPAVPRARVQWWETLVRLSGAPLGPVNSHAPGSGQTQRSR